VDDNADMSDVDFEDVSVGQRGCFGQQQNFHFIEGNMVIIFTRGVIIGTRTIMLS
jgi:hypothetical protein